MEGEAPLSGQTDPISAADRAYFEARAEKELELACRARHAAAVQAHYQLATFYLDLVHDGPAAARA